MSYISLSYNLGYNLMKCRDLVELQLPACCLKFVSALEYRVRNARLNDDLSLNTMARANLVVLAWNICIYFVKFHDIFQLYRPPRWAALAGEDGSWSMWYSTHCHDYTANAAHWSTASSFYCLLIPRDSGKSILTVPKLGPEQSYLDSVKKNQNNRSLSQPWVRAGIYIVPTVWQDNGRDGLQVQSLESSESVCVLRMKIMRLNLSLSLFPVYSLWAHRQFKESGHFMAFCCDSLAVGRTSINLWKKERKK